MTSRTIFVAALLAARALAAPAEELDVRNAELLSRVQALAGQAASPAEWRELNQKLEDLARELEAEGRTDQEVRLRLVQANVLGKRLHDPEEAVRVLDQVRQRYAGRTAPDLRPVYVALARYLACCGQQQRIQALIEEFRRSPQYDGEVYPYRGGWGREIPLEVVRPRPRGSESLTVTSMQRYLREALADVGDPCPPFVAVDLDGRRHTPGEYRGKVLLIDFWQPGWAGWQRHFERLAALYRAYHRRGLEILSICYARRPGGEQGVLREMKVSWPLVYDGRMMAARFGLYGEWGNVVVNRMGVITARDVRGGDLSRAVRDALGLQ